MKKEKNTKKTDNLFKLSTDEEAYSVLEKSLEKKLPDDVKLNFDGWPILKLEYKGTNFNGTINPDIAQFILDLQEVLNRSYNLGVNKTLNLRYLDNDTKKNLNVKVTVKKGSSLVEIKLGDWAQKLASELVGKMTGPEIATVIIGCAAVFTAGWLLKKHIEHRSTEKRIKLENDSRLQLSQEETKRLDIVTKAISQSKVVSESYVMAETVRDSLLKTAFDADSLKIQGSFTIDSDDAKSAYRPKRRESSDIQLNGIYRVRQFGWPESDLARLRLFRVNDGLEFNADINYLDFDAIEKNALKEATFSKTEIYLEVNATLLHEKVTTAIIVGIKKSEEKSK